MSDVKANTLKALAALLAQVNPSDLAAVITPAKGNGRKAKATKVYHTTFAVKPGQRPGYVQLIFGGPVAPEMSARLRAAGFRFNPANREVGGLGPRWFGPEAHVASLK